MILKSYLILTVTRHRLGVYCLLRHYEANWSVATNLWGEIRLVVIEDERESVMIFQEMIPGTRSRMGKFPWQRLLMIKIPREKSDVRSRSNHIHEHTTSKRNRNGVSKRKGLGLQWKGSTLTSHNNIHLIPGIRSRWEFSLSKTVDDKFIEK